MNIGREFMASIVVFLVALPLCMGIAIASGVPVALGLITGIVGGLIVATVAGSPLQVSGPAAGLAVVVYEIVKTHGLQALGVIVLLAGAVQIVAGLLKLGKWFRAVSPAVIRGMLAGIGVLIFASQFHVMVDDKPKATGIQNLLTIPEALYKGVFPLDGDVHHLAAAIGLLTIVSLILWNVFKPKFLKSVPGALIAIILASGTTALMGLGINLVKVPDSLISAANWIPTESLASMLTNPAILASALTVAAIASAETLLCATAVDRLHDGVRTDYDRELFSQGVGNMICGVFGALPMTGVIVRSSANVESGATTRLSAIMHGAWLLAFVAALPFVLSYIPTSALAAILVFTGYKLVNPKAIIEMWKFDKTETVIFFITVIGIVATDLLTGVLLGIAAATLRLVFRLAKLRVETIVHEDRAEVELVLSGVATFISLPTLSDALDKLPADHKIIARIDNLVYIDHACLELLVNWDTTRTAQNNVLVVERHRLMSKYKGTKEEPAPAGAVDPT